jgi:hypothetical protein
MAIEAGIGVATLIRVKDTPPIPHMGSRDAIGMRRAAAFDS